MEATTFKPVLLGMLAIVAALAMACGDSGCPTLNPPPTPPLSIGSPCDSDSQCSDPGGLFTGVCTPQEGMGCVCTAASTP